MEIIFENLSLDFESGRKNWILFKNSTFKSNLNVKFKTTLFNFICIYLNLEGLKS